MGSCVAVGADWDEIVHRVHLVRTLDLSQRPNVMHVNEASERSAIHSPEVEATRATSVAVVPKAFFSRMGIPLVSVHPDSLRVSLDEDSISSDFLRQQRRQIGRRDSGAPTD